MALALTVSNKVNAMIRYDTGTRDISSCTNTATQNIEH